jgi:hypothetical protein
MPHHQFPSTYVYWESLKDHDELKAKYMPIIDKIERDRPGDLDTVSGVCTLKFRSYDRDYVINNFLEPRDINRIIWNPLDNFIEEINSKYQRKIEVKDSIVDGYWFNTYDKYDNQEMHNHNANIRIKNGEEYHPIFSGIYILNDENESSSIIFRTYEVPFRPLLEPYTFCTSEMSDIKEGTVIIFPTPLLHMVSNCIKPGRRTIAFNIFSSVCGSE